MVDFAHGFWSSGVARNPHSTNLNKHESFAVIERKKMIG